MFSQTPSPLPNERFSVSLIRLPVQIHHNLSISRHGIVLFRDTEVTQARKIGCMQAAIFVRPHRKTCRFETRFMQPVLALQRDFGLNE